jgi:catechol 2,3-dioxygenase-like lactoylglutathione lyase family enzyme
MLRRFDRMLVRVNVLPAAIRYWQDVLGATLVSQSPTSAHLHLPDDGGEIVLHTDANLPEQAMYLLVEDVRATYDRRAEMRLEFRSPPAKGVRGYHAAVRDPFGVVLLIADRTIELASAHAIDAASSDALFSNAAPTKHKPNRELLGELYEQVGRTADDLPYTTHFESLFDAYTKSYPEPKPDKAEVWRHLLTTRKASQLPKLGAARSKPPEMSDEDRDLLRRLLGDAIGRRDRLPYSEEFDTLVDRFNQGRRRPFSPHLVWRMAATLAK